MPKHPRLVLLPGIHQTHLDYRVRRIAHEYFLGAQNHFRWYDACDAIDAAQRDSHPRRVIAELLRSSQERAILEIARFPTDALMGDVLATYLPLITEDCTTHVERCCWQELSRHRQP